MSNNLKRNANLRDEVLREAIEASRLVTMKPEEMMTKEKKEELQKNLQYQKDKTRSDYYKQKQLREGSQSIFKCKKCGSQKCDYEQKQTRSADEPMTVFVTCLNCDNRWKQ